jgi:mono/diheme cytochrome c family protein
MRIIILLIYISGLISWISAEDFITKFEYGQMLYRDPHGASCAACHGETGAGKLVAEYTNKEGARVILQGPDIRHATIEQIRHSITRSRGIMPRYFLTDKEISTIYAYLQKVNKTKISDLFATPESNQTQP